MTGHPFVNFCCLSPSVVHTFHTGKLLRPHLCVHWASKGLQSVSVAMATKPVSCRSFFWGNQGPGRRWFLKVLTQTGIKVGQKRHERKSKRCLPVLLPPWPKASLPSPEANGNHAFSLKLWRGLKSWISLPLQDTITLLFVWQDEQQDKRRGARVGYSGSGWSGTVTLEGESKPGRESTVLDWDIWEKQQKNSFA